MKCPGLESNRMQIQSQVIVLLVRGAEFINPFASVANQDPVLHNTYTDYSTVHIGQILII